MKKVALLIVLCLLSAVFALVPIGCDYSGSYWNNYFSKQTAGQNSASESDSSKSNALQAEQEEAAEPIEEAQEEPKTIKNIIIVIGDGMGAEHISAGELAFEKHYAFTDWHNVMVNTDSLRSDGTASHTTDSAAAATALATGTLTTNGYIGKDKDGNDLTTVMDVAKLCNKSTGILTTDKLYGATPAGFSAHSTSRNNTSEILDTQLASGVDFLCGTSSSTCAGYFDKYQANGFATCSDFGSAYELINQEKAFCLFDLAGTNAQVSLKDATAFAVDFLSKDEDGFVLLVEEAYIDKYSHNNDFDGMIHAMDGLNSTIDFLTQWASQRGDTAILVTADHETGNLSVGMNTTLSSSYQTPSGTLYYNWEQTSHSDSDTLLFTYGFSQDFAICEYFRSSHLIKNTDIATVVKNLINNNNN